MINFYYILLIKYPYKLILEKKHNWNLYSSIENKIERNNIKIEYIHDNKKYKFINPYIRINKLDFSNVEVVLIKGNTITDITRQPGIEYNICAKDFKGDNIVLTYYKENRTSCTTKLDKDDILTIVSIQSFINQEKDKNK